MTSVAVVSTGSELTRGLTVNSNAAFVSKLLTESGFDVPLHVTIPDDSIAICKFTEMALREADAAIFTGGLGPTLDDLTRDIAKILGLRKLKLDRDSYARIEKRYRSRHLKMNEFSALPAYLPEGAIVIRNVHGTAPGFIMRIRGKPLICLPGVPVEMREMFQAVVLPWLQKNFKVRWSGRAQFVKFCGVPESTVDAAVRSLVNEFSITVAGPLVTCRFEGISRRNLKEIVKMFRHNVFAMENTSIDEAAGAALLKSRRTLAIAESLTGGLVADRLVGTAGISEVLLGSFVAYTDAAKEKMLGIPRSVIKEFSAVSDQVAMMMAIQARERLGADIGISTTGFAGPTGKKVGSVLFGVSSAAGNSVHFKQFAGDRRTIRTAASSYALWLLMNAISDSD